jgi:hypothetical protein
MPDLPTIYDGARGSRTMFDGDEYDSNTEASFAEWLKAPGRGCTFERQQWFRDNGIRYKLDFAGHSPIVPGTVYVEIKPRRDDMPEWLFDHRAEVDEILAKMETIWGSVPHAPLAVVFWNDGDKYPRLFFLHRGYRWRLINEDQGSRLPW